MNRRLLFWSASRATPWSGAGLLRYDRARDADRLGRPRLRVDVRQHRNDFLADERLLLEERHSETVERCAVLLQQPQSLGVRRVGEQGMLAVAQPLRLLRQRVVVGAQRAR